MPVRAASPPGLEVLGDLAGHRLLLREPDDIRHVLVRNAEGYAKSRRVSGGRATYPRARSLLTSRGGEHRRRRRTVQRVFRRHLLEELARRARSNAARWAGSLAEEARFDLHEEMTALSRLNTLDALMGDSPSERLAGLSEATAVRRRAFEHRFFSPFPLAEYVPSRLNRDHQAATRRLRTAISAEVSERRRAPGERHDLLALLMDAAGEDGRRLSDRDVTEEALTVSVTGYDSVSECLTWTLYLLARHPEHEEAAAAELASTGPADAPRTERMVRESLRLYPPTWLFVRVALERDRLPSGEEVGAGEKVYLCPYAVHRDPALWPDPDEFRPERFAADRFPEQVGARPKYAYFPFGGGPHVCIGETLAMGQVLHALAGILTTRRLTLTDPSPAEPWGGLTLRPRDPLVVRAEARVSA